MTSFFTTEFMATEYSNTVSQSAQGQLSSQYEASLTSFLQTEAADWIGFLAKTVEGLTTEQALAVKALVEAGSFSLSGLFGAAQSKTGAVEGTSITDPEPTLTVTLGETVVNIDLKAILGSLDTESWTYTETNNSGKKTTTTTTYHTREFYTDGHEPEGYDPDWDEVDPPVEQHDQIVETIVKDNSSEPDDTFNVTLDMLGTGWNDLVLTVSATGDYDGSNEKVTISGDLIATLELDTPTQINVGGSNSDNALNDFFDPVTVTATNYGDGEVNLVVAFTNQVNNDSSVTLTLDYDYFV